MSTEFFIKSLYILENELRLKENILHTHFAPIIILPDITCQLSNLNEGSGLESGTKSLKSKDKGQKSNFKPTDPGKEDRGVPITDRQIDLKDDNAELVSDEHSESNKDGRLIVVYNELHVETPMQTGEVAVLKEIT